MVMSLAAKQHKAGYQRQFRATENGKAFTREAQWKYLGIVDATYEKYIAKIAQQDCKCTVCKCEIDSTCPLDHDHKTGLMRDVLCTRCNLLVGIVETAMKQIQDTDVLESIYQYLRG